MHIYIYIFESMYFMHVCGCSKQIYITASGTAIDSMKTCCDNHSRKSPHFLLFSRSHFS